MPLVTLPYTRPQTNEPSGLGPPAILARRDVPALQQLVVLRSKGWDADHLDGHFKALRQNSDKPTKQAEYTWFTSMKKIMGELDQVADFVPSSRKLRFLDVGCAPGGFSSYILQKNRSAVGTGISLSEDTGGHALLLEKYLRTRYKHLQEDILGYDWFPAPSTENSNRPGKWFPDAFLSRFPLVILDGHAVRTYHHPSITAAVVDADLLKAAHGAYRDRLLITQLIIALASVSPGGTVVMRLSHLECFPAAPLLYLLDSISDNVVVFKPKTMHTVRGTSYVIAKGVFGSKTQTMLGKWYLDGLKTLWRTLQQEGPYDGVGRMLAEGDLDFVASAEVILDQYVDRLVELGLQVWLTQIEGLRRLFDKKGIQ